MTEPQAVAVLEPGPVVLVMQAGLVTKPVLKEPQRPKVVRALPKWEQETGDRVRKYVRD